MNISSAENHVQKLLDYVSGLRDADSKMYEKSKTRLRDISKNCREVVSIIATILQEEALVCDSFDTPLASSDILESIRAMQQETARLQAFILQHPEEVTMSPEGRTGEPVTISARKACIAQYATTLKRVAYADTLYPAAHDLAELLWKWFSVRFLDTQPIQFKYNIRRIPIWIRNIILAYGAELDHGDLATFVNDVYTWCDRVQTDNQSAPYAVPYRIYQMDVAIQPTDYSLTSVVLYDILFDLGLTGVQGVQPSDLALSPYSVYDLVSSGAPDVLDNYRHYLSDLSILSECNIFSKKGVTTCD